MTGYQVFGVVLVAWNTMIAATWVAFGSFPGTPFALAAAILIGIVLILFGGK